MYASVRCNRSSEARCDGYVLYVPWVGRYDQHVEAGSRQYLFAMSAVVPDDAHNESGDFTHPIDNTRSMHNSCMESSFMGGTTYVKALTWVRSSGQR